MTSREPDPDRGSSQRIAEHLLGDAHGVSLTGPQHRIDNILALLRGRVDQDRLLPVQIQAARSTPATLREQVGRAHAGRPSTETVLLLIVPDAGRLTAEMLRELEQAAEAAMSLGGLKFLLASAAPLASMLRDAGLNHLHDCLDAHVAVMPPAAAALPAEPERRALVDHPPAKRAATRRVNRLLLAAAVLLGVLLLVLVIRPARKSTVPPAPPAAQIPQPPAVSPRPVAPPPVVVPAAPSPTPVAPPSPPAAAALPPPAAATAPAPPGRPETSAAPAPVVQGASTLLLMAQPGDTLPVLYAKVYAGSTPPPYADVVALNPVVRPGTRLIFPAPPGGWRPAP